MWKSSDGISSCFISHHVLDLVLMNDGERIGVICVSWKVVNWGEMEKYYRHTTTACNRDSWPNTHGYMYIGQRDET